MTATFQLSVVMNADSHTLSRSIHTGGYSSTGYDLQKLIYDGLPVLLVHHDIHDPTNVQTFACI